MKYCTNGVLEARNPEPLLNSTNEQCTINGKKKGKKFWVFAVNDFLRDIGEMCNKYYRSKCQSMSLFLYYFILSFVWHTFKLFQEKSAVSAVDEP